MIQDPKQLADTRIQLHWAAQAMSAAADATLDRIADDSHSNFGWDSAKKIIVGRTGTYIDVSSFSMHHENDSLDITGKTLKEVMQWLGQKLGVELTARDYDMPAHPVAEGQAFSPNQDHLNAIADWFVFAQTTLAEFGELRIWPHHFDLGFFKPKIVGEHSIGGGFSIGDDHYPFPYIYVNPYGKDRPQDLSPLAHGFWTDKWFGAVIATDEFGGEDGLDVASAFSKNAMSNCLRVLSTGGGC